MSEILSIDIFHIDRLFWKSEWKSVTYSELEEKLYEVVKLDSWIIDGNYSNTFEIRAKAADTIILLDIGVITCLLSVIKRRFKYHKKTRPDMTEGCIEVLRLEFLWYVICFPYKRLKRTLEKVEKYSENRNIVVLKSRKDMEGFLCSLKENKPIDKFYTHSLS